MKKLMMGVMLAAMAFALAACTPTTEKQKENTTAAADMETIPMTTGGASDKVPDPNVKPVAVISIYHGSDDSDGIVQPPLPLPDRPIPESLVFPSTCRLCTPSFTPSPFRNFCIHIVPKGIRSMVQLLHGLLLAMLLGFIIPDIGPQLRDQTCAPLMHPDFISIEH